jgi:hypothetical protein
MRSTTPNMNEPLGGRGDHSLQRVIRELTSRRIYRDLALRALKISAPT